MRTIPSVTLALIVWLSLSPTAVVGQTSSTNRAAPKKSATTTDPLAALTQQVQDYQKLLLSTQQPNRDFYRVGIGLNLLDVFGKLKNGPSASATPETPAAPATKPGTSTAAPAPKNP